MLAHSLRLPPVISSPSHPIREDQSQVGMIILPRRTYSTPFPSSSSRLHFGSDSIEYLSVSPARKRSIAAHAIIAALSIRHTRQSLSEIMAIDDVPVHR